MGRIKSFYVRAGASVVVLSLIAAAVVVVAAPDAEAAVYNPIPLNADLEPDETFVDDDALFVYVTSDIKGGKVCAVPADGGGCVWGTTTLVGIGSVFAPMEGPSLPVGQWRIRSEDTEGQQTGLSEVFVVSACATCSREYAETRLQEWKDRALGMKTGLGLTCVASNVLKDTAERSTRARGKSKKPTERAEAYDGGSGGFIGHDRPSPEGWRSRSSRRTRWQYNQDKAMEILKDLSCAAGAMYNDIYNDPPDPDFATVVEPRFATIGDSDRDSLDRLMAALDRQTAFGEAALTSYERYLGAVAAGDDAAAVKQAQAASDYTFQQVAEMGASSSALRAYASDLATQPTFNDPLATPANWALIEAAHDRVATEGFSPAELAATAGRWHVGGAGRRHSDAL